MKPEIKVSFKSFWQPFNPKKMPQDYFFEYVLSQAYDVTYDDENPDIVFYSVFGQPPNKKDYKKEPLFISFSGEPTEINSYADLHLGFDVNDRDDYFRLPLWVMYILWDTEQIKNKLLFQNRTGQGSHDAPEMNISHKDNPLRLTNILHRIPEQFKKYFCNFTYSNPVNSRIEFFMKLKKYKFIHSTGKLANNTPRMNCKVLELSDYKFTIAFENTLKTGYVTEKLLEPLISGSVPIYFGDSQALQDFNPHAFIHVNKYGSFDDVIDFIRFIDNNDSLYFDYLNQPIFNTLPQYPTYLLKKIQKLL